MKDAYVIFTKSRIKCPLIGRIIEFFQKGKSHVAIMFYIDMDKNWYVVDSTGSGVKTHTMDNFSKKNKVVKRYSIPSTEQQKIMIMRRAIESSYEHYPRLEIVGNLVQIVFGWIGIIIGNPFKMGEKAPRCNEYVAIILRDIYGFEIKEDLDSTDLLWLEEYLDKKLS